ncbi:MAG: pyridoxal-phosphate dependent enzyme [Pseudomonadota bacterium]
MATAVHKAADRLAEQVVETPVIETAIPGLNGVSLKLENCQHTGSFKFRGALNRLLAASNEERERGFVTASSGNHGAALARAMQAQSVSGVIFVPEQTSEQKLGVIKSAGGEVRFHGTDGLDTELHARAYARTHNRTYVSPYNDPHIIAGQGTIGLELLRQVPDIERAVISIGGGGLISGIAAALKTANPDIRIVGCQPQASDIMTASVSAGYVVEKESLPTLSDGTAGGVESDAITFPLCRALVDEFLTVTEDDIAEAMRLAWQHDQLRIEGAAGVAIAALSQLTSLDRNTAVIICGGNVSDQCFDDVLAGRD